MRLFTSIDEIPPDLGRTAIAIGKFDGVHVGHRAVLELLKREAAERGLASVVVTFDRNPLSVIRPEISPEPLVSNSQKIELLEAAGVDAAYMIAFDQSVASAPARPWAEEMLVDGLHAGLVIAGRDFRFGFKAAGDVALLEELGREHGFEVIVADDVRGDGERRASSTWIRELLGQGRVREAAQLLGRRPSLRSVVVHGDHRGKKLGFPTANLDAAAMEGFIPADGVYAAWAAIGGARYPAAVSIGDNPTFDGVEQRQVEAHLIDVEEEIYGRRIELQFVECLRPMVAFDSAEALVAQLERDVAAARETLAADAAAA